MPYPLDRRSAATRDGHRSSHGGGNGCGTRRATLQVFIAAFGQASDGAVHSA